MIYVEPTKEEDKTLDKIRFNMMLLGVEDDIKDFNKCHISKGDIPRYRDYCICGHKIKNNYYVKNNDRFPFILVVGKCCYEKYF